MSLSLVPQKAVKVIDPRLDLTGNHFYAVVEGAGKSTIQPVLTSTSSPSGQVFSVYTPSPSVVVSRRVLWKNTFCISITGQVAPGRRLLNLGVSDAPRAFPAHQLATTMSAMINNTTTTFNSGDLISALSHINGDTLRKYADECPNFPDNCQSYDTFLNTLKNPLGDESNSADKARRGAFDIEVLSNPVNDTRNPREQTAVVRWTSVEPIMMSPFVWTRTAQGMTGVQSMTFTMTFGGNLSRLWSRAGGAVAITAGARIDDTNYPFIADPTLYFEYLTPKPTSTSVPKTLTLPYHEVVRYTTGGFGAIPAFGAGDTAVLTSNNIQLQSVPSKLVIFARRRNADLTALTPDCFIALKNLSIQWSNQTGILSTASQFSLYEIAKRNNVDLDWVEFSGIAGSLVGGAHQRVGTTGSVMVLEMGTDIPLDVMDVPGKLGTYQLSVQGTFQNTSAGAITPELYIVAINEGTITFDSGRTITQIGVVSSADVLDAPVKHQARYDQVHSVFGGSFLSSLKEGWQKYVQPALPALEYAHKGADVVNKVLGKGLVYDDSEEEGGGHSGGGRSGGGRSGGRLLARSALKNRLQ